MKKPTSYSSDILLNLQSCSSCTPLCRPKLDDANILRRTSTFCRTTTLVKHPHFHSSISTSTHWSTSSTFCRWTRSTGRCCCKGSAGPLNRLIDWVGIIEEESVLSTKISRANKFCLQVERDREICYR